MTQTTESAASPVYGAIYSGVGVYEMSCRQVAVMRRRYDKYLNATQILKVAGVDKGRRTKILEKEVQTGQHEKVQGGYGKYQGTWYVLLAFYLSLVLSFIFFTGFRLSGVWKLLSSMVFMSI